MPTVQSIELRIEAFQADSAVDLVLDLQFVKSGQREKDPFALQQRTKTVCVFLNRRS